METRKVTLIAAIVAILLLAVGVGFAYTAYTENSNNTSDVAYLKLTQTGDNAYNFTKGVDPIKFDTFNETNTSTIYYSLKNPITIDNDDTALTNDYSCAKLGSITLQSAFTSTTTTTPPANVNIDVASSEKFDSNGTWVFFVTNTAHTEIYAYKNTAQATKGWTDGPDALTIAYNGSVTVDILYGYDSTITPAKTVGDEKFYSYNIDLSQPLLNGASLIFSAKDYGTGGEIENPTSTTLNASALAAKNVTLTPGYGTEAPITIKHIGSYKLPSCTFTAPSGQVFSKWQIGDNQYAAGTTVTITDTTTITAVWIDQA